MDDLSDFRLNNNYINKIFKKINYESTSSCRSLSSAALAILLVDAINYLQKSKVSVRNYYLQDDYLG